MKVKVIVEYDVVTEKDLVGRDLSNMVGMLVRQTRNRVRGFVTKRLGGDQVETGWEVTVKGVEVSPETKT